MPTEVFISHSWEDHELVGQFKNILSRTYSAYQVMSFERDQPVILPDGESDIIVANQEMARTLYILARKKESYLRKSHEVELKRKEIVEQRMKIEAQRTVVEQRMKIEGQRKKIEEQERKIRDLLNLRQLMSQADVDPVLKRFAERMTRYREESGESGNSGELKARSLIEDSQAQIRDAQTRIEDPQVQLEDAEARSKISLLDVENYQLRDEEAYFREEVSNIERRAEYMRLYEDDKSFIEIMWKNLQGKWSGDLAEILSKGGFGVNHPSLKRDPTALLATLASRMCDSDIFVALYTDFYQYSNWCSLEMSMSSRFRVPSIVVEVTQNLIVPPYRNVATHNVSWSDQAAIEKLLKTAVERDERRLSEYPSLA
jgi:hypothetical protein